jgi:3-deoxy-7-phosphoheptulonate synthase
MNSNTTVAVAVTALALMWAGAIGLFLGSRMHSHPLTDENKKRKKKEKSMHSRSRETSSILNGEDARMIDRHALIDVHIAEIRPLLPPACLIEEIPRTVSIARTVNRGRQDVSNVLNRVDDRLVVVVGPCSIHDIDAAKEYGKISLSTY